MKKKVSILTSQRAIFTSANMSEHLSGRAHKCQMKTISPVPYILYILIDLHREITATLRKVDRILIAVVLSLFCFCVHHTCFAPNSASTNYAIYSHHRIVYDGDFKIYGYRLKFTFTDNTKLF